MEADGNSGTDSSGSGSSEDADIGLDDEVVAAADVGIGATIMGRNMFGPVRGPWRDPGHRRRNSGRDGGGTNRRSTTRSSW